MLQISFKSLYWPLHFVIKGNLWSQCGMQKFLLFSFIFYFLFFIANTFNSVNVAKGLTTKRERAKNILIIVFKKKKNLSEDIFFTGSKQEELLHKMFVTRDYSIFPFPVVNKDAHRGGPGEGYKLGSPRKIKKASKLKCNKTQQRCILPKF